MSPGIIAIFCVTILIDVAGQLCFKLGTQGLPRLSGRTGHGVFWSGIFSSSWLWLGVAAYALELFLWIMVLANAPLSLVFPLASISYCGVMLASRIILKETVPRTRWAGAILITLGVAILCIGGEV